MSLKSLTKKIPFWEISLVTLFFFTGYGVSVYKQSNLVAQEKATSKSIDSPLVDDSLDLDLDQFLAGLEESEWSDADLEPLPLSYKDPHLKSKKYERTLKKQQAARPKTQAHHTPTKTHTALASNAKNPQREPLFDTQGMDAIPNEHLTGNTDLESKEQLESLFTMNDVSESSEALVPNENGESKPSVPLKKKKAKKLKKKKIKDTVAPQDENGIDTRMADASPASDAFMGSWGEHEEDSFALAMNDSPQENGEKWNSNETDQEQSDWFTHAAQSQTPDNGPTSVQPISDFIGQSTSIESSLKAFSNQDQTQENSEGLRGRAFDQDEYEYLTNQGYDDNENRDLSKQAAWGGTLSAIEGSQFGPGTDQSQNGFDYFQIDQGASQIFADDFDPYEPSGEYSNLTEFDQDDYPPELRAELFGDSQSIVNCDQTALPVVHTFTPGPLARRLPPRQRAYGRVIRRLPPPPPGFRAPYPRGSRPVAYRMLPPPPRPQWR